MKTKNLLSALFAGCMVLAAATAAEARPFIPGLGNQREAISEGLQAILELKLTPSQQEQMMRIITRYQNQKEALREAMREARSDITKAMADPQFTEQEARSAFRKASAIREEMFVLNGRMKNELKAVLTPEQAGRLKERRAMKLEGMKNRIRAWTENPGE